MPSTVHGNFVGLFTRYEEDSIKLEEIICSLCLVRICNGEAIVLINFRKV